ncbi:hypothetical protein HDU98_008260 [Podochytrium sp. JEL0797]|nr:hypothetical protein HDU98_008260 [Podochytrium sp. JEL0797]
MTSTATSPTHQQHQPFPPTILTDPTQTDSIQPLNLLDATLVLPATFATTLEPNYTTGSTAAATSTVRTRSRKPTVSPHPAAGVAGGVGSADAGAAEREVVINQLLELQESVRGLIERVESARIDHGKMAAENAMLLKYINNLM